MEHKEIDEERFLSINDVLPPIYFNEIDGKEVFGIANGEPYTHSSQGVVYIVVYKFEGRYYEAKATLKTKEGVTIHQTDPYIMSRGNKATTYKFLTMY